MANEAVKVEGPYEYHDFTVASGTLISAMTLCVISDPRTAAASSTTTDAAPFAGIVNTQKSATSNAVELSLITKGVFELTAAGSDIPKGQLVALSGINLIQPAVAIDLLSGAVVGKAWEGIAASTTGEVHVGEVV